MKVLLGILIVVVACVSGVRRDPLPLLSGSVENVTHAIERGFYDASENGDVSEARLGDLLGHVHLMAQAVGEGDLDAIRDVDIPLMRQWAWRGLQDRIDDGEISVGARVSLLMEVDQFFELMEDAR